MQCVTGVRFLAVTGSVRKNAKLEGGDAHAGLFRSRCQSREGVPVSEGLPGTAGRSEATGLNLTLGVLLVVYIFNFLDRQIVAILAEPIAKDLSLSDTQIGVLTGLAFAMFYTTLGFPIARYADRAKTDRVRLIALATAIWSVITALCGMAANFTQLLLARIGVGVGEAGCTPPAHSLITDIAPPEKRARAFALYQLGPPVGGLIGMVLGGVLADSVGWRNAFIVVGLPGLLAALLVMALLRDPRRDENFRAERPAPRQTGASEALREILASRAMVRLLIASALASFSLYGVMIWTAIFFQRSHGLTAGETGLWFGLANGIASIAGVWLGGMFGDAQLRRGKQHLLTVPSLALIGSSPLFLAALLVADWRVAMLGMAASILLNWLYVAPYYSAVQGLAAPRNRAVASALVLFLQNAVGIGIGPVLLGYVSDLLKPEYGDESVRYVLFVTAAFSTLGGLVLWTARKYLPDELDRAH